MRQLVTLGALTVVLLSLPAVRVSGPVAARAAGFGPARAGLVAPPKPGKAPFTRLSGVWSDRFTRVRGERSVRSRLGQGLGPPGDDFAKAFGKLVPGVEYTYNPAPGYPAVGLVTAVFHLDAYRASITSGVKQLRAMIGAQYTVCGTRTKLILAGYSQGAELVGDAYLAELATDRRSAANIAGVVLFADPLYNHLDPSDFRTDQQMENQSVLHHNGSLTVHGLWHVGAPHSFPQATIGHVLSYCLINDLVCQGLGGNPFSHQHPAYPANGYPQDAANWLAAQTAFDTPFPISTVTPAACNSGGTLIADTTLHRDNDITIQPSYGIPAYPWALVDYDQHEMIWQLDATDFCLYLTRTGTFTTAAGKSPSGNLQIPAGIKGSFEGATVYRFQGGWDGRIHMGLQPAENDGCTISSGQVRCSGGTPNGLTLTQETPLGSPAGNDWRFRSSSGDVFWWDGAHEALGDILR